MWRRRERYDEFQHRPGGVRYRYQLDRIERRVTLTVTLVGILVVVLIVVIVLAILR